MRESPLEAVRGADAAVIVTEWPELRELASPETLEAMSGNLIVDGRNLLDPDEVRAAGFAYEGIGRPPISPVTGLPESEEEPAPHDLMEAILLAGGQAERLGDAAQGRPKPLVPVGGRPLAAYALARFARAGVERVIVACSAGTGDLFERELAGLSWRSWRWRNRSRSGGAAPFASQLRR